MRFEVITIFPELFGSFLQKGLVAKAHESGVIQVHCTNIRDFTRTGTRAWTTRPTAAAAAW
jgi:tRNA (guanine37-N1)-methyltransferase